MLLEILTFLLLLYLSRTATVQNNFVPTPNSDSRISNFELTKQDSKNIIPVDSLLNPVNAVADIDTFFVDEDTEVNLI